MLKIGRLKPDKKWNYGLSFADDFHTCNPLIKEFSIWCFKIINPNFDRNAIFDPKKDIKGFWYKKRLFTKWDIVVKTKSVRFIYSIRFIKKK